MFFAYCFVNGVVEFGAKTPRGAIEIAFDTNETRLREKLTGACRHARPRVDPPVLLVPGIPEANDQSEAGDALQAFKRFIGFANIPKLTVFQRTALLHIYDPVLYLRPNGKHYAGSLYRRVGFMQKIGLFERGSQRLTSKAMLAIARHYEGERDIMADAYEKMADERTVEKNRIAAKALADKERLEFQEAQKIAEIAAMRRIFPECAGVPDDEMRSRMSMVLSI